MFFIVCTFVSRNLCTTDCKKMQVLNFHNNDNFHSTLEKPQCENVNLFFLNQNSLKNTYIFVWKLLLLHFCQYEGHISSSKTNGEKTYRFPMLWAFDNLNTVRTFSWHRFAFSTGSAHHFWTPTIPQLMALNIRCDRKIIKITQLNVFLIFRMPNAKLNLFTIIQVTRFSTA